MTSGWAFSGGSPPLRGEPPEKILSFFANSPLTFRKMERIITFHENPKKVEEGLRRQGERPEAPSGGRNAPGGIPEHVHAGRVGALAADRQGGREEPHAVRPGQARGRGHGVNRAVEAGAAGAEGAVYVGEGGVRERLCRAARRREERDAERQRRAREWRERTAREVLAGVEVGGHPERRPGVPPAAEPDVEEAVAEYAEFMRKTWGTLGPLFKDIYAGHDESLCLYTDDTVVCTFLAVTMLKCRSRNAVDGCRNSEGMAASMLYLSDQGWWLSGARRSGPTSATSDASCSFRATSSCAARTSDGEADAAFRYLKPSHSGLPQQRGGDGNALSKTASHAQKATQYFKIQACGATKWSRMPGFLEYLFSAPSHLILGAVFGILPRNFPKKGRNY